MLLLVMQVDLTKHIAVFTHTAHPHVDRDGTVYNIGQGVGPLGPRYHICKFPKTKTDAKGELGPVVVPLIS